MSAAECPVGCGRRVAVGKLLCGPCWSNVPAHMQRDVYATWRTYQKAHRDRVGLSGNEAIRAAREAYQAARDAAITAAGG